MMPATEFRFRRFWLAIGAVLVLLTIAGSLAPSLPDTTFSLNDKLLHLFVYGVLGSWFGAIINAPGRVFSALLALGLSMELLQMLGGSRHAEYLDMVANACGALLGVMLVGRFVARPVLLFIDQRFADASKPTDIDS
jgi:VanZ family protein